MASDTAPAVGIDLGTTYSCVAAFYNGKIRVISNEQGNPTTPSFVAFTDEKRLIGDAAKNQVAVNTLNTVYDSKRLIGRKFSDPVVQKDMKNWSFKVVSDSDGNPKIEVNYLKTVQLFTPEEISSTILTNIKQTAERFLRAPVKDAVITVPAYFNNAQRQATKDAGTIAGLNVLQIINEPTAAALAYGMEQKVQGMQIVLIYDLGGGTFDVSIIRIINGSDFEVKTVAGDNHLGGEDFDDRLVDHFAEEFKRQYGMDLKGNSRSLRRLRSACERAKRTLSSATEASVEVECLFDGRDFCSTITRSRFEMLCMDLFQGTLKPVAQALKDAKLEKSNIDEVIMVGGSTRIPKIQQLLGEFFNQKKLNNTINPDEAVAYGAAVHASKLTGIDCCEVQNVKLLDVVPLSLGIELYSKLMANLIDRNARIPCDITKSFYTVFPYQTEVAVNVYEGENKIAAKNNLLGVFNLTKITPTAGAAEIYVTFKLNSDGILTAIAKERSKNNTKEIKIDIKNGRLTKTDVDRMLVQSMKYCEIDEAQKKKLAARNALIDYIKKCEMGISNDLVSRPLSRADVQQIQTKCGQEMQWVSSNKNLETNVLEKRLHDFKKFIDTFAWNFNKNKLV